MGKLVQVATETVTSAVASVTLTGIDSDDVYMLAINNYTTCFMIVVQRFRVTKSGTAQTDANYDSAYKELKADTSFSNGALTNNSDFQLNLQEMAQGKYQAILYLYNFNSSSEYSFVAYESVQVNQTPNNHGTAGGGVHTVASASDGIQFRFHSGNISSGTFTLYKVI